jgi:hypothetical protein
MATIDLTDEELAAVAVALRRLIDEDKFPHAPRLDPLRSALAKLEQASEPQPPAAKSDPPAAEQPRTPKKPPRSR